MIRFHCLRTGASKLSAHSFREYLQTNLEAAGVNVNWIDQIIGHRLINSRDAYSIPSDEELLKAYMDAYPQLRVYPDKVETDKRLTALETEIAEKNKVIADLVTNENSKAANVEALLKRVLELEKRLGEPKR